MFTTDATNAPQDKIDDGVVIYWPTILALICVSTREGMPQPPSLWLQSWGLHPVILCTGLLYLYPLERWWSWYLYGPRHWSPCWSVGPLFRAPYHLVRSLSAIQMMCLIMVTRSQGGTL